MPSYRDNYLRAGTLIVERGTKSQRQLLQYYLNKKNTNLPDFINSKQHDIFHLYSNDCCQCAGQTETTNVLRRKQMEIIFVKNAATGRHPDPFCCSISKMGVRIEDFDMTLLHCILVNICSDMFWEVCLQNEGSSLEQFLEGHKHEIYHLWNSNTSKCQHVPCVGQPVVKGKINEKQWLSLYQKSGAPTQCRAAKSCFCAFSVKSKIHESHISKLLSSILLKQFCPLRIVIENLVEERNRWAHTTDCSLSDQSFENTWTACTSYLMNMASYMNTPSETSVEIELIKTRPLGDNVQSQLQTVVLQEITQELEEIKKTQQETLVQLEQIKKVYEGNVTKKFRIIKAHETQNKEKRKMKALPLGIPSKPHHSCIAAIDIGTYYSAYAYCFERNSNKINTNCPWKSIQHSSLKTPSCIMFDEELENICFGYDAELKYSRIQEDSDANDFFYFENMQMHLCNDKRNFYKMSISDAGEKAYPARTVFSIFIRAFSTHLCERLQHTGRKFTMKEFYWIVAIPSKWCDEGKQFLRTCVEEAGIAMEDFSLCDEALASSLYSLNTLSMTEPEDKYTNVEDHLVIDIGGDTLDITALHRNKNGEYYEICRISSSAINGCYLNAQILLLLKRVFGEEIVRKLQREFPEDYYELTVNIRRLIYTSTNSENKFFLKFPSSLAELFLAETNVAGSDKASCLASAVEASGLDDKMSIFRDKIRIDAELIMQSFARFNDRLIFEIEQFCRENNLEQIPLLILVGGVAESEIVQNAVQQAFPMQSILVPKDPILAVVKGAVLFGTTISSSIISIRVSRRTFGIRSMPVFDKSKHKKEKLVTVDGIDRCKDVFETFLQAGDEITLGSCVEREINTIRKNQDYVAVAMYTSDSPHINYVDETACSKIGDIMVHVPNPSTEINYIDVKIEFGSTEIFVEATERKSGKQSAANFFFEKF